MESSASVNVTSKANVTNTTTGAEEPFSVVFPQDLTIGVTVFAVIVFLVSLIGNTIILYIVFSCRHMRNTTNILIANMAVADLWLTIDIPYVMKWLFVGEAWFGGVFGKILCPFCHSAQVGSVACSVLTLVCISLDRSLAILLPMRTIVTIRKVKIMIVVIWFFTLGFVIPLLLATEVSEMPDGSIVCVETGWETKISLSFRSYHIFFVLSTYVFPLTLITIMYAMTGLRLWNRRAPGHRSLRVHKRIQSFSKRATAMLVTVVIVFAICWSPLQIRELVESLGSAESLSLPLSMYIIFPWFGFANSAMNPIIYFVFSENYRREIKRTFTRVSRRRRRSSSSQVSRGTTLRTRMSLSTSVPLQKLRNDSCIPTDGEPSKELLPKRSHRDSKIDSPRGFLVLKETPESGSVCGSLDANTSDNNDIDIQMDDGHCALNS